MLEATKVVNVHAEVFYPGVGEFKVYADGSVALWDEEHTEWFVYDSCEDHFNEVQTAGLAVLKG